MTATCGHCGGWQLAGRKARKAQPRSVFGSPEDIIERGTDTLAKATERLGVAIARSVHGLSSARAIQAAIRKTGREWNVNRIAFPLERELAQGQWLGALDADFEARTDRRIAVPSFAALHSPILLAPYDKSTDPAFATRPVGDARKQFEHREPVTRDVYDAMTDAARRRSVTVAGGATKEIVRTVQRELVRQVAEGADLRDFSRRVVPRLEAAGWTPVNDSHAENVLRTNVATAYNAGRARQMTQPAVLRYRPYWQIVTVNDGPPRQRPAHQAAHLAVLRADDPFWLEAYPPFGYQCRCRVRSISRREGEDRWTTGAALRSTLPAPGLPDPGFTSGLSVLDIPPPQTPPANDTVPPPANDTIPPQGSLARPGIREQLESISRTVDIDDDELGLAAAAALDEAGLTEMFKPGELSNIQITAKPLTTNGRTGVASGNYDFSKGLLQVDISPASLAEFADHKPLGTPGAWSVIESATTDAERARAIVLHESGHAVHMGVGNLSDAVRIKADAIVFDAGRDDPAYDQKDYLSEYAAESREEYFAEAFAAYKLDRAWLKKHAPRAFKMVEQMLRLRGLL